MRDLQQNTILTSTGTARFVPRNDGWALFSINGSFTGFQFVMEGLPYGAADVAANYVPLFMLRSDNTSDTGTLSPPDNTGRAWYVNGQGMQKFGPRATALTTGAPNVQLEYSDFFVQPPSQVLGAGASSNVQISDGTNTQKFNTSNTLLASGARTTTQTSADLTNVNARGIQVILDMTVVGTGSVTVSILGKDPTSGKYYTLLAGAAVVTNVTNVYTVYPGAPATTNVSANAPLPQTFQIVVTANNANTATYSVGYNLIL